MLPDDCWKPFYPKIRDESLPAYLNQRGFSTFWTAFRMIHRESWVRFYYLQKTGFGVLCFTVYMGQTRPKHL